MWTAVPRGGPLAIPKVPAHLPSTFQKPSHITTSFLQHLFFLYNPYDHPSSHLEEAAAFKEDKTLCASCGGLHEPTLSRRGSSQWVATLAGAGPSVGSPHHLPLPLPAVWTVCLPAAALRWLRHRLERRGL